MYKLTRREEAIINAMKYLKSKDSTLKYYAHYNSMFKCWDYCLYKGSNIIGSLKVTLGE